MCSRDKNDQKSSATAVGRTHGWSTKRITYTGMFVAIAMVFSYLESMIPVNIAIPGIKLGFANMVTIVVMYRLRIADAWIVSLVRVVLSSLLFGNMAIMIYSMAGAVLSLLVMSICRKGSVRTTWNKYTRRSEPQRRSDSHGGISHEKREYHVVHTGAVHIGNDSRCMYRPCGGGACQKASVHRILE